MPAFEPASGQIRHRLAGRASRTCAAAGLLLLVAPGAAAAPGQAAEGARLFRACIACHSLEPGRHRTGPSLAGIFGRSAGTAEGFRRYSPALKHSGVVWDETTLDAWLRDPAAFIPGNRMTFPGLREDQARADLIAYLGQATSSSAAPPQEDRGGMMGGGMMGGGELPDLKTAALESRVTEIRHCGDTYEVTTADGATEPFWEFNLRFKTDGSDLGPGPGRPVIVGAGMMGDRASIVFAGPAEISPFIQDACQSE